MTELGLTCRTFCRKLAAGEDEAATVELVLDAVLWEICRELECKPNDTRLRLARQIRRDVTAPFYCGKDGLLGRSGPKSKKLYYWLVFIRRFKIQVIKASIEKHLSRSVAGDKCFP